MKIAIIREGKVPVDHRVALLPEHCQALQAQYPQLSFKVEPSEVRCIPDEAYRQAGIEVSSDLHDCDIFFGVKEVPIEQLIPHKTYFFFSHTIKAQAYNRELLQHILQNKIRLIDYECLTNTKGQRIVAFGRFAGIVGAYNGIKTYGERSQRFQLKPAHKCPDYEALKAELQKADLPPIKIAVTGTGRVGKGAKEILDALKIDKVSPEDFLHEEYPYPVYAILGSGKYYKAKAGQVWSLKEFYQSPENFHADFLKYARVSDLLITAHYWHPKAEPLFRKADMRAENFRIRVIADVTCDVEGSIPSTLRVSTIADPVYDYNPETEALEAAYQQASNITVMAVDNLPCELPYDASKSFGEQLSEQVFPALLGEDSDKIIERATIASAQGKLMPNFAYLQSFVESSD